MPAPQGDKWVEKPDLCEAQCATPSPSTQAQDMPQCTNCSIFIQGPRTTLAELLQGAAPPHHTEERRQAWKPAG